MLVRPATPSDSASIAAIYNEGIEDRSATFETRLRTAADVASWFDGAHPIVAAEEEGKVIGFAASSTYRPRECYKGIAEFSVYVARATRGRGVGRLLLDALISSCEKAGFWKLVSRVFLDNESSRRLLRSVGFREVGVYEKHGQLDGVWRDVLIVERLLSANISTRSAMLPLHRDAHFTFRFADDRVIPRFHLEGVAKGIDVSIRRINPSGEMLGSPTSAIVGEAGWVDLQQPILVRAGEGFIALPIQVRAETEMDYEAIREIDKLAFGQDDEVKLVDELRAGGFSPIHLVAEVGGRVVGHVLFSDLGIQTERGRVSALALAPLAVLPEFQKRGIGSVLVRRGLDLCRESGHRIIVVLGHSEYYPRFGFSAALAQTLESPFGSGPEHMAIELVPGAMSEVRGKLVYARPFHDLG